ncbi:MAG: helix-turn-helix transcriptional regulator [Thermodesulfobacteriota bacterium]
MKLKSLNIRETAELLEVSRSTLWRWIKWGCCPPYKKLPSGLYRFRRADVQKWLESMVVDPQSEKRVKDRG